VVRLTAPQLRALRYYATEGRERWQQASPRADVRGRLGALGLLRFRTEWAHTGLTYRSRQRYTVVDVFVTDAGRALLDSLS
jgi:hypothetical protein